MRSDTATAPATAAAAPPAVWKVFLMFLGPMMLSNILQSLSGTINSVFLGHMIGVQALAAASAFFPLMLFLISFIMGLGAGASVLIGQAWGAKNAERVQAVAGTTIMCSLLVGSGIALLGVIFAPSLLRMLATPADILGPATTYARVMLLAMPGLFVFLIVTSIMRGVGDMMTPLKALAVSTLVGLVLTPALIRGWLGLPPLGVASAAYASIAAFLVTLVWLGFHLKRKGHALAPSAALMSHMKIEPAIFKAVMRIGIPTAVQMVTMSLAEVALLSVVNSFGSAATASYGIGNQVLGYVQFPAMSIAIAGSILGAQAIGAGHTERLGLITRTGLLLNVIITGSLLVLGYLFSRSLIGFFTGDPAVTEISQRMLYIILWSTLMFGGATVFSGVMRASGTVLPPTILAISAILLVEIPSAFYLSSRIGIDGVWWAYPLTFTTMFVLQGSFYWFVWRRRKITRLI